MKWAIVLLLIASTSLCTADELQDSDLNDLRAQIDKLGKQVKAAKTGEDEARKLLEDSKATALSFESEVSQLKTNLADKDLHGDTLQQQISLLQGEAAKLREGQDLHKDLVKKFEAVTQELEATKDTLANTLAQLADKTSSANSAQLSVTDAKSALKKAESERDNALEQLKRQDTSAAASSKETSRLQSEIQALQTEIAAVKEKSARAESTSQAEVAALTQEKAKLKHAAMDLRGKLQISDMDAKSWKQEAEAAKGQIEAAQQKVASAERQLEKAMKDQTATQAALIQAESKAEEAVQKMNALLTSWLPHWLDDRYKQVLQSVDPARKKVEPYLNAAWVRSKSFSDLSQKHASMAYTATKARSLKAYQQSRPALEKLWLQIQKLWGQLTKQAAQVAGPGWEKLKARTAKQYKSTTNAASKWATQNRQLQRLRRSGNRTIRDLENLASKYLQKIPGLKPYAKKPEVTYLVWAALLSPFFLILAPLLVFKGEQRRGAEVLDTRNPAIGRGAVTPQPGAKGASKTKKPVRRISVGEEHVRVP